VHILAHRTPSKLVMSVKDNGVGMSMEKMKQLNERLSINDYWMQKNKNGVGLENINARIKLIFGEDFGVSVISTQNVGTTVTLTMGIIDYPNENPDKIVYN